MATSKKPQKHHQSADGDKRKSTGQARSIAQRKASSSRKKK